MREFYFIGIELLLLLSPILFYFIGFKNKGEIFYSKKIIISFLGLLAIYTLLRFNEISFFNDEIDHVIIVILFLLLLVYFFLFMRKYKITRIITKTLIVICSFICLLYGTIGFLGVMFNASSLEYLVQCEDIICKKNTASGGATTSYSIHKERIVRKIGIFEILISKKTRRR